MSRVVRQLPHPADFAPPPGEGDVARWLAADEAARPARLARLRARFTGEGVDAYFGIRPEHMRYLTGFALEDGEDRVSGNSGRFLIGGEEVVVLADSRYRLQAQAQCPGARVENVTYDLAASWPELVRSIGARRVAVEAGFVSHQLWQELAQAAPDVELVAAPAWLEADRAVKEPAEVERIRAACTVADRALASIVRKIKPGLVSEKSLALDLEWEMRTCGAEALAFGVACLTGPNAALPHGSPSERSVCASEVILFDFGAMVAGYRSDMTRTLFVGEPTARDMAIYEIVAAAQQAAIDLVSSAAATGSQVTGREGDAAARSVIEAAGHGDHFGHGTGHGIGLATHELPSLSRVAPETPLTGPTVFSVEPGIYIDGETGVRIEDLVLFDPGSRRAERLTAFPREVTVVGV